jgi:hypothetical protein
MFEPEIVYALCTVHTNRHALALEQTCQVVANSQPIEEGGYAVSRVLLNGCCWKSLLIVECCLKSVSLVKIGQV